jgi:hypothetical protein
MSDSSTTPEHLPPESLGDIIAEVATQAPINYEARRPHRNDHLVVGFNLAKIAEDLGDDL